jgi:hypothetical protein
MGCVTLRATTKMTSATAVMWSGVSERATRLVVGSGTMGGVATARRCPPSGVESRTLLRVGTRTMESVMRADIVSLGRIRQTAVRTRHLVKLGSTKMVAQWKAAYLGSLFRRLRYAPDALTISTKDILQQSLRRRDWGFVHYINLRRV